MHNKGQSLIEILIVIALMSILLPAIIAGFYVSREAKPQQQQRMRAAELLKESQEIIRIIRENGWSNIPANGTFHPVRSGNSWTLLEGAEVIIPTEITREIIISDVNRLNGQIVTSGGTLDPSTKAINIRISWIQPISSVVESQFYLSRYLENDTHTQTTQAEFDTGIPFSTDVITTEDDDGEVTLGAGGAGSWCIPSVPVFELDLPKQGVANAVTAIEEEAYVGTGENASGVSLANIVITNDDDPSASIYGTFDGYKTNDVFCEADYFYVATHRPNREVVIVRISSLPFAEIGYYNPPPGIEDAAKSIYVDGTVGYVTVNNQLFTFNLTSKIGARSTYDSITLAGIGESVVVKDGYAYVAISGSTSYEMQIVNVANPSDISIVGSANVDGQNAIDLAINDTSTRIYLVTGSSTSNRELFIIDISDKNGARPVLGSYDTNGMDPRGTTLVPGNRLITVGIGGEEYQVININNEANPLRCGGIEVNNGINGVASVLEGDGDAYSYIITGDGNAEFKIIAGGPGGNFATNGTYESADFEIGYTIAFNRFIPTVIEPEGTSINFQIAVADAVSGSCADADYVFTGPDGQTDSFYEATGPITFDDDGIGYENPGRCMRYRAYLFTNNSNSSPILEKVIINYSR